MSSEQPVHAYEALSIAVRLVEAHPQKQLLLGHLATLRELRDAERRDYLDKLDNGEL